MPRGSEACRLGRRLRQHGLEFILVFIQPAGDEGCPEGIPLLLGNGGRPGVQVAVSCNDDWHAAAAFSFMALRRAR